MRTARIHLSAFTIAGLLGLVPLTAAGQATSESAVVLRRLDPGPDVNSYYWTPSPDGRLLSFVDWTSGNLSVRDLATGEVRPVTDKGTWQDSGGFAETSAISPDGESIAYAWCCGEGGYELRVSRLDGSERRTLVGVSGYVMVAGWSPDAAQILAWLLRRPPGSDASEQGFDEARSGLQLVSAADGSSTPVAPNSAAFLSRPAFSPDGRFLAYDGPERRGTIRGALAGGEGPPDVYVLDLMSGEETRIVGGPGHDVFMGWAADGEGIFVYSDRSGSPSIWTVPVVDGRAADAPELLRAGVEGPESFGGVNGAAGGRVFYTVIVDRPAVHTMVTDLTSGRLLAAPTRERAPAPGETTNPAWSPDGRYLAFIQRPFALARNAPGNLVVRSVGGDHLRQLPLPIFVGTGGYLGWTPDSKSVLVASGGGVFRMDLQTGETHRLEGDSGPVRGFGGRAGLTRDGRQIYTAGDGVRGIMRLDLVTGEHDMLVEDVALGEGGCCQDLSLSPDGETLAVAKGGRIALLPVAGGEPRDIFESSNALIQSRGGLQWTPGGEELLVVTRPFDPPGPQELWIMPAAGGEPRRLFAFENMYHVRLHPDGRRIAFTGGTRRGELWVMEPEHGRHDETR